MARKPRFRFLTFIHIVLGLVLTLFTFALAQPAMALPTVRVCTEIGGVEICVEVPGISGGGSLATANGPAQFTLFATGITASGAAGEPVVRGQVQWTATDANGEQLLLQTVETTDYGPIEGTEGGRFIHGTMSVNGEGEYPFVLNAVDAGPPGEAQDTVSLAVGSEVEGASSSDFGYAAEGPLETGDIQLLNFVEPAPEP